MRRSSPQAVSISLSAAFFSSPPRKAAAVFKWRFFSPSTKVRVFSGAPGKTGFPSGPLAASLAASIRESVTPEKGGDHHHFYVYTACMICIFGIFKHRYKSGKGFF
jgi:hypothetical protein